MILYKNRKSISNKAIFLLYLLIIVFANIFILSSCGNKNGQLGCRTKEITGQVDEELDWTFSLKGGDGNYEFDIPRIADYFHEEQGVAFSFDKKNAILKGTPKLAIHTRLYWTLTDSSDKFSDGMIDFNIDSKEITSGITVINARVGVPFTSLLNISGGDGCYTCWSIPDNPENDRGAIEYYGLEFTLNMTIDTKNDAGPTRETTNQKQITIQYNIEDLSGNTAIGTIILKILAA